jgi:predicted dehydrogenase
MSADKKLRWGFMGCASIASKNYLAIKSSSHNEIVAVASRSLEKAKAWAAERKEASMRCYGSYEELLADADVDAIYMPLPTTMHLEWAVKAADAKKHILIEKPVALNCGEYRKIIDACIRNGVFIMDGTMFSHHKRLDKMVEFLKTKEIGELKRFESGFSFMADESWLTTNIRTSASLDPLGALGDLSHYQIRFTLHAFEGEMPTHVAVFCHKKSPDGVPIDCSVTLFYKENSKVATFNCSFVTGFRQWVEVAGTKGRLMVDDFVICKSSEECSFDVLVNPGLTDSHRKVIEDSKRTITVYGCNQEATMFDDFALLAFNRDAEKEKAWRTLTLKTQAVLDACMESVAKGGEGQKVEVVVPEFL